MRNPTKKRAPHGATSLMVLDAMWRLHTQGGRRIKVSRVDLLRAVSLPETTVDDRLRTLVKDGRVLRAGRALYVPTPWPGQEPRRSELPGTEKTTAFPDGMAVKETWHRIG
jgi:hypothetical protein